MVKVMDYILKHPNVTVADIRERFSISSDEYNMIFDLCMPVIRNKNAKMFWRQKYTMLRDAVSERIRQEEKKSKLSDDIWDILENYGIGKNNITAKSELEESA